MSRKTHYGLYAYQCQTTLLMPIECPCRNCTLWRIEVATREQAAAEAAQPTSWIQRLFTRA